MNKAIIFACVFLTGCKLDFTNDKIGSADECWSPSAKDGATEMITNSAKAAFIKSLPPDMPAPNQYDVSASFTVKLNAWFVTSYDPNSGAANCGATITYSYARPDASTFTNDGRNTISFEVYQTDSGPNTYLSGLDQNFPSSIQYDPGSSDTGQPNNP